MPLQYSSRDMCKILWWLSRKIFNGKKMYISIKFELWNKMLSEMGNRFLFGIKKEQHLYSTVGYQKFPNGIFIWIIIFVIYLIMPSILFANSPASLITDFLSINLYHIVLLNGHWIQKGMDVYVYDGCIGAIL